MYVYIIACGVDRYPRNMACKVTYSCSKLANRKACKKKFNQVLPKWCWNKLAGRDRIQFVRNYCKRSCKNCVGRFIMYYYGRKSFFDL